MKADAGKAGKGWNWDEAQQTILLIFSFAFWGAFEFMCYTNPQYASAPYTAGIRIVLINLVTNLFTYIYTKSQPSAKNGATSNGEPKPDG